MMPSFDCRRFWQGTLVGVTALLLAVALVGCAQNQSNPLDPPLRHESDRQEVRLPELVRVPGSVRGQAGGRDGNPALEIFDLVTVLWGTNRRIPADLSRDNIGRLASENGKRLTTGFAHVTIPKIGRDAGSIQRPRRFAPLGVTLYEEAENPRRHFTIGDIKPLDLQAFTAAADSSRRLSRRFKDEAIVFVHGFNTPFDAALFRTAQLAYDLEFDGVPYVFSWPSLGSLEGYLHDKDAADAARRYLQEFLGLIARDGQFKRVHLIAHSMGARLLAEVLQAMPPPSTSAPRFEQVILAAPDIDSDVFQEIAGKVRGAGKAVTLYAARNDKALTSSRILAAGRARAGEVTKHGPTVAQGIDTIDITDAGFSTLWGLNHSTFAERSPVLKDLQILLEKGTRPPEVRLASYARIQSVGSAVYWKYRRD
jgi:esterase/lipase superfamily enzyme